MNFRAKIFLALLLCLQTIFGFAQVKKQHCGNAACDSFYVSQLDKKLKLPSLLKSKDSLYFRYYTNCNVVDVWSKDGITFNGVVTTFTRSYPEYDKLVYGKKYKRKAASYFFAKDSMDAVRAKKVYDISLKIQAIPTSNDIKEWEIGDDGETFVFQTATPSCICMKRYWSPDAQRKTLSVAQTVDSVIAEIDSILNFQNRFHNFSKQLKPGSYHNGLSVLTIIYGQKQRKRMAKQ